VFVYFVTSSFSLNIASVGLLTSRHVWCMQMIMRMIDDHKNPVESACETARDILAQTDDAREKRLVSADVDKLMAHWNSINSTAASQLAAVEAALVASGDYHSKADPLSEWLNSAEKRMAALELVTADSPAIQHHIELQRVSVICVLFSHPFFHC